jgi:hypothetical protein
LPENFVLDTLVQAPVKATLVSWILRAWNVGPYDHGLPPGRPASVPSTRYRCETSRASDCVTAVAGPLEAVVQVLGDARAAW